MPIKRIEKTLDTIATCLLIFTGIVGYFVVFLDFIGTDFTNGPWNWLKGPLPIVLLITATLSLSLGIERFVRFNKMDQRIHNLELLMEQAIGGRFLGNRIEVYQTAEWLLNDVNTKIRVTILAKMEQPSPKSYTDTFVNILKQSKKSSTPILVDMVIYGDFHEDKKEIQRIVKVLFMSLKQKGVKDLVKVYVADIAWGVDFLILNTNQVDNHRF